MEEVINLCQLMRNCLEKFKKPPIIGWLFCCEGPDQIGATFDFVAKGRIELPTYGL
jgi:hypothetical protein